MKKNKNINLQAVLTTLYVPNGSPWRQTRYRVAERQGFKCYSCGEHYGFENWRSMQVYPEVPELTDKLKKGELTPSQRRVAEQILDKESNLRAYCKEHGEEAWQRIKEFVAWLYNYKCADCSKQYKNWRRLNIHHKQQKRKGGSNYLNNLEAVCWKYHTQKPGHEHLRERRETARHKRIFGGDKA